MRTVGVGQTVVILDNAHKGSFAHVSRPYVFDVITSMFMCLVSLQISVAKATGPHNPDAHNDMNLVSFAYLQIVALSTLVNL